MKWYEKKPEVSPELVQHLIRGPYRYWHRMPAKVHEDDLIHVAIILGTSVEMLKVLMRPCDAPMSPCDYLN